MTSVGGFIKQIPSEGRFFMPLSSLQGLIYTVPAGTENLGQPSTAAWSQTVALGGANVQGNGAYLSSINGAGAGRLRDMGQTYVSASRVFRKVQLVVNTGGPAPSTGGVSTFGVAGAAGTADLADYLTGFIELGYEGSGPTAPVARMG